MDQGSPDTRPPLGRYEDLARMIDHSLLQPTLTDAELEEGCRLAVRYGEPVFSLRVRLDLRHRSIDRVQR
jgi:hypothetical protein